MHPRTNRVARRPMVFGLCFGIGVVVILMGTGCSLRGTPIRLYGSSPAAAQLVGSWSGEYVGDVSHNRRGTISFVLQADDLEAYGDVIMLANGLDGPYSRYGGMDMVPLGVEQRPDRQALTIRFVSVDRDIVTGVLDPYWDPDRRTTAQSTFRGRVTDNVIEGTFVTTYTGREPSTGGRWKVRRYGPR